jgi:MFS-type transporter involved in bile tolerance (Atg22 family)
MFWIILLALTLSLLDGPEKGKFVLVIAPFIGTGFGWYYPSSNGFFVSLVPLDAVTELWGWNMLATVILSFVPPLVFMAVNEAGGNLQLGFMGSMIFLVIGFFLALTITTSDTDAKTVRASSHSILAGTMADDDESGDDDDTDGDVAGTNDEEKNYWKDSTVVDSSVV